MTLSLGSNSYKFKLFVKRISLMCYLRNNVISYYVLNLAIAGAESAIGLGILVAFYRLRGSIVSGFFGRKVGVSGAQLITCTSVIVTTLLAIVAFFEV
ncbi:uncharacterized protein RAG0_17758 [Rhynchosporium agropyri]|uniref:Uncharacterized protein n=1 Tax=Rhynchosporium agropyri TaxID=914238 RepID=A0A1E1LU10_9HELO|nr:uncharacterized protein RAG0_17758 [Rhynchosporium agropyri]